MSDEKFYSSDLYLVRPSTVVYDNTIRKNVLSTDVTHIVKFKTNLNDITITSTSTERDVRTRDLFSEEYMYTSIGRHCIEGDKYINVKPGDKILLARYLWEANLKRAKYSLEIENYILSLKPYYTIEELRVILDTWKRIDKLQGECFGYNKPFTYKKRYKEVYAFSKEKDSKLI